MFNKIKEWWNRNKCTTCGKRISRLEWGGRLHITSIYSTYIHPEDYVWVMKCKTNKEKRYVISRMEATQRIVRKLNKSKGAKFCRDHYLGCPD